MCQSVPWGTSPAEVFPKGVCLGLYLGLSTSLLVCSRLSGWALAVVESVSGMATWVSLTVTFSGIFQASLSFSTHLIDAGLPPAPPLPLYLFCASNYVCAISLGNQQ